MAADRELKKRIVEFLRDRDHFYAGNETIIAELGVSKDDFFEARNELVFEGVVERGRGRGGTTWLIRFRSDEEGERAAADEPANDAQEAVAAGEAAAEQVLREHDFYEPILKQLQSDWAKNQSLTASFASVCANKKRNAPGLWSVPDLVAWGKRTFKFIKDPVFSVFTFEVKTLDGFDIRAIYEAAAHRMAANYSYVIVVGEVPSEQLDDRLRLACAQTGVGLIVAEKADDYSSWDEFIDAKRHEPDPEMFDAFVSWSPSEFESDIVKMMK